MEENQGHKPVFIKSCRIPQDLTIQDPVSHRVNWDYCYLGSWVGTHKIPQDSRKSSVKYMACFQKIFFFVS